MNATEFITKWRGMSIKERSGAQEHFIDLCQLVNHPTPATYDPSGESFTFEMGVKKAGGGQGFADVWFKDHFAWEYKGPGKDLDKAYDQLLLYRENLLNPPLLVVSDFEHIQIHTNFTGSVPKTYDIHIEQLDQDTFYDQVYNLFHHPHKLDPKLSPEKVTGDAAQRFAELADQLRRDHPPRKVAHFLTQLVFCFFAEDIGLLPGREGKRGGVLTEIIEKSQGDQYRLFPEAARDLFGAMVGGGRVWLNQIKHFNGGLFEDERDTLFVPLLTPDQLGTLYTVAQMDWSGIEPTIFGTLFERGLNPDKRGQLGAHYTSKADILAIVEPVLMAPLRREWDSVRAKADKASPAEKESLRGGMLEKLKATTVLDPACGSGNFLYVSLNQLLDLEKKVLTYPAFVDLPRLSPAVHPCQLNGIEMSDYAHELASVVIWIGYIQWHRRNGYVYEQVPLLQKLNNILCIDAILAVDEDGKPYKPAWPEAKVIVGNPPFLGSKKMRSELGSDYVDLLHDLYGEIVYGEADFVTYWFEIAREQINKQRAQRVGLLATQGIRGQVNRGTLERIKRDGNIFFAYSDRKWILDGAMVRVSMVGFDNGTETERLLDGESVHNINADLTKGLDLTTAVQLDENQDIAYMGTTKGGAFDLTPEQAQEMLSAPLNPNGRSNSDVIRPWRNGRDITDRSRDYWIIDFGTDMTLEQASMYEMPFEHIKTHVKPVRASNRQKAYREKWWLFAASRSGMREAFKKLGKYIATARVSKYRIFVWLDTSILPDSQLIVFARDDDYFFGVLHSKVHEIWSLRQSTQLRDKSSGNRYTPTTTFQTYPFPWAPGEEPTDDPRVQAISEAAWELNDQREAWLNPERGPNQELSSYESMLNKRTLTNLYNDNPTWLQLAHERLDRAVFAAYGWDYDELVIDGVVDEEEILRRLLELNLERAG